MAELDPEGAFSSLKNRALDAIKTHFPVEGRRHTLKLLGLEVLEDASASTSPHSLDNVDAQYSARTTGTTWGPKIRGEFSLIDNETGKEIDRSRAVIAQLPKLTKRYSYIVKGNERQVDGVFRLNPGAYHVIASNGDIMAKWNMSEANKTGRFGIRLETKDPKKAGRLNFDIKGRKIPVYSILTTLGVSDSAMRKSWGDLVYERNREYSKPRDLRSLYEALEKSSRKKKVVSTQDLPEYCREAFASTKVNSETMLSSLGKPFDSATGEALLLSCKKLLQISREEAEPDDRQSLSHKQLYSTEDFVAERLSRSGWQIRKKIWNNLDRKDRIREILPGPNQSYNKIIFKVFEDAQLPTQTNPLQFVANHTRTTIQGQAFGGIKGGETIMDEDQLINPSHLGFLDPLQTPESEGTGITLHLPLGVKKDPGGHLKTRVVNVRTKAYEMLTAAQMERAVVAYPDQVKIVREGGKIKSVTPIGKDVVVYDRDRSTARRPWSAVQYVLPSSKALFSLSANLIPFVQNNNGNRAMMAAKHQEQAISLSKREAPLVQTQVGNRPGLTFEKLVGQFSSVIANVSGVVTKVTSSGIYIKDEKGQAVRHPIYDHYPLNGSKHMLHSEPVVKVGDRVKKGQTIADSNFTKDGSLSLGTNLRVAYIPYKGYNFEDGIVISETAAEKLSSSHLHVESIVQYKGMVLNRDLWRTYAPPDKATPQRLQKLGDNGIIRVGQKVDPGDPLIAILASGAMKKEHEELRVVSKGAVKDYIDRAIYWEHDYVGVVAKVVSHGKKHSVYVRTEQKLEPGDKLSGRHGNKGIVTKILPDHDMPADKGGDPVHVLLSPAGVPSRMNVGQVLETAASKIARKTGKPYIVDNFDSAKDYTEQVKADLKKHKISDTEELFDPETGRSLGPIMTGHQYVLKLDHQAEKKVYARAGGMKYGYNPAGAPSGGSGVGPISRGQKISLLDTYALLAHGAVHNLREAQTYKSDVDQSDVWTRVMAGRPLPAPKVPRSMIMFQGYMRAMGIDSERKGDKYVLSPLTDKQILAQSNGELKFPAKTLVAKGTITKEERGGLFDPGKTGGVDGKHWTHITLEDRYPNPIFERAIRSVLGLTGAEFEHLVSKDGMVGSSKKSGFQELSDRLAKIDVDKDLAAAEGALKIARKDKLNAAHKKVRYLKALKKTGISPLDAYTHKRVPVLPPAMRRISIGFDGSQIIDPLNQLYLVVGQMNDQIKKQDRATPKELQQKTRADMYDTLRALKMSGLDQGIGDKKKHLPSLLEKLSGDSPKTSFFQTQVLGKRQDLSGRSIITPEPNLNLDEVGVPLPVALEIYKPFIVQDLWRRTGKANGPTAALKLIKEKDEKAVSALRRVMENRPVLLKRDPALHKFNVMAFKPKLVNGKAIQIHPLVTGGFNADFDGDAMALYVPVSEQAVQEAKTKMLPSKNLFSPTHGGLMPTPSQDALLGLYQATKWGRAKNVSGLTREKALRMLENGDLKPSDVIRVQGLPKATTPGRLRLAKALPVEMKDDPELLYDKAFRLDKTNMKAFMTRAAKANKSHYPRLADDWKALGYRMSYLHGSSFSLDDFHDGKEIRDRVLKSFRAEEDAVRSSTSRRTTKDSKIVDIYTNPKTGAMQKLEEIGTRHYKKKGTNRMYEWVQSGARGGWNQFGQLVMGPMIVSDATKNPVPVPITTSFGEGLPISQYWASLHGARKGTIDRAKGTKDPGALTKDIANTVIGYQVTSEDCGTKKGIHVPALGGDIEGRYLAADVQLKNKETLSRGTLVTSQILTRIRNSSKSDKIIVRSPLHCAQSKGICAVCYGLSERGKNLSLGTNIGMLAGHALSEPVTQMTMRTFHTGGVGGASKLDHYKQAKDLFNVPEKLKDQAVISKEAGPIVSIAKDMALGGQLLTIGSTIHQIPASRKLLSGIQKGQQVRKGQPLTDGRVNPHELLATTGSMGVVRNHITHELMKLYPGDTKRRNVETVVRAMTNLTRISDPKDNAELLKGQFLPLSTVESMNRDIRTQGGAVVRHTPTLKPLDKMPLFMQEDWMARLNYQRLKDTYLEGAAQGWSSDIHGHPITGLAHGAEFGLEPTTTEVSQFKVPTP